MRLKIILRDKIKEYDSSYKTLTQKRNILR